MKKTKTGLLHQCGSADKLRGKHPIIEQILDYRQLTKLKSTYVDGLGKVIGDDGASTPASRTPSPPPAG